ncbi:adenylyltransferase and sulfurtransferase [Mucilaginibacter pineti]|uniref:Molybdopterin-synthase adenylyltransferase n=1 Tax=Mucilaginibacter pineti TaxID=1391627 RepID=A0A1G7HV23_9SPHI|nr:HesA/MoeB/ThiF family protein [Mucilaginibacter pineti]SDF04310.1 adenylyltransferase and sulfurtransferase [Mucilaginibacter pineti]
MNADDIRYSCQVALPGFGEAGQALLKQAKVLIVGAGGLGCPSAQYLTASGIGTLGIADYDVVAISNLHRQVLYTPADAGRLKATVACQRLQKQNPGVKLIPHTDKVTSDNVLDLVRQYDIIIDGTDNFETRYLLNDACVLSGKPLVYGAIYQFEGQVAVWNLLNKDGMRSPNYRDLFPDVDATQIPNCTEGGVIPTLAGIIGCMQANEVIKYVTKTGELLAGKVLIFDAQTMQSRIIKLGPVSKTNIRRLKTTVTIPTITADELKQRLQNNDDTIELVDVRTEQERDAFDIGGTHIPLDELEGYLAFFTGPKTKVLYCATGNRSEEAVKLILRKLPEADVLSLEGGLKEYILAGD